MSVEFPVPKRAAYMKFPQPASRYALVGGFVADTPTGIRVGVTGAGPCAFRAKTLEAALSKQFSSETLHGLSVSAEDLNSDIHGSAEYRAHLVVVMAKRAVDEIVQGI